jgi:archaeosine synthase
MNFRVHYRDGPARIGTLTVEKKEVVTPNILFLHTSRCQAPVFADILLSNQIQKTKKPTLRIGESIFSTEAKKIKDAFSVDNYLVYPKDVSEELHLSSIQTNDKNSDCYIIPGKKESISDAVKNNNAELYIVAHAVQLFSHQSQFVDFVTELRQKMGYQKLMYLPGVGDPTNMSLLAYMGVDLFDSFSAFMAARNNVLLFSTGSWKNSELNELPCSCPSCAGLQGKISEMQYEQILEHNYHALFTEVKQVRNAIFSGSLRELVEIRVRTNPQLAAMLRLMDRNQYPFLEERTPIVRKQQLIATTKDALVRPEIRRFQERVITRYQKPPSTKILLLLPCSAKKPYSFSKSHKLFRERLLSIKNPYVVHEVIITSPLGLVPRELELTYPASAYDIAVTGQWDEDEKKIIRTLLQQYLKKNTYDTTIMHLPEAIQEFIADLLTNPVSTCNNTPTSPASLDELSNVLQQTTQKYDQIKPSQRAYENIIALACYQFGKPIADHLLKDCTITGKYPYQKIMQKNTQLGMITEERGFLSLTMSGADRLISAHEYWVEISDDFTLKGSVFTPGIKNADASIRIGDEVVIIRNTKPCGVGVALMNGTEMTELNHGEAVKVRHHR